MLSVQSIIFKPGDAYAARRRSSSFDRRKMVKTTDKYVAPVHVRIAGTPQLSGGKMPIAKIVAFLKTAKTPNDKLLAIFALKNRGAEAVVAVPHLIKMLHDSIQKVQRAATDTLVGLCSSSDALRKMRHIEGLRQALTNIVDTHSKWEVRSFALKVAIKIATPAEAVDILLSGVTNREWRICTDSLFYMRSKPILAAIKAAKQEKTVVSIIVHFLGHPRSAVRIGVAETLSAFGSAAKASEAAVLKRIAVEKEGVITFRIARLLGALNKGVKPSARANAIGQALAKVASSDKDWAARASAAKALGLVGRAVAHIAVPALVDLIADGRRKMERIKRTCMELSNECDLKTDKYFNAMTKAEQAISWGMGRGRAVWRALIGLWSHDDELVRDYSARLWANMFWKATYQDLPE